MKRLLTITQGEYIMAIKLVFVAMVAATFLHMYESSAQAERIIALQQAVTAEMSTLEAQMTASEISDANAEILSMLQKAGK
jgi:hypothetical protein